MDDVIIIGGGVVGCMIARELSKYNLAITLVEKNEDVACGTSKANSAVIHAGFDAKPGTLKAKLNVRGNTFFPALCEELDVPFKNNGSLVLAFDDEEINTVGELMERGKTNGVPGLDYWDTDKILEVEPYLKKTVRRALYAPTAGIICPYEFTIALAENSYQNGVKYLFEAPVTGVEKITDENLVVRTSKGDLQGKYVINAAGLFADEISKLAGAEEYQIIPRKGEYLIFDKEYGYLAQMVLFPTPSKISKGILVCPTVDGNVFIGPNSNNIDDKTDVSVQREGIEEIISGGKKIVPDLPLKNIITSFAGLRASSTKGDFIIEASQKVKGFINVGGIESPGFTSSPAIAEMIVEILINEGLKLEKKNNFIPHRPRKYRFREMDNEAREKLIKQNPDFGHVICRCETVTKGEIVDAIRRPLGARSIDGIKRRTRAGMGRCQGGFCSPKVLAILAEELKVKPTVIRKANGGSEVLLGKIKEYL